MMQKLHFLAMITLLLATGCNLKKDRSNERLSILLNTTAAIGSISIDEQLINDISMTLIKEDGLSRQSVSTLAQGALSLMDQNESGASLWSKIKFWLTGSTDFNRGDVTQVAPVIIEGMFGAMSTTGAKLTDDNAKLAVAGTATKAMFVSLKDKIKDLSPEKRQSLPGLIAGRAVASLDNGGISKDALAKGIGSVVKETTAGLSSAGFSASELTAAVQGVAKGSMSALAETGLGSDALAGAASSLMASAVSGLGSLMDDGLIDTGAITDMVGPMMESASSAMGSLDLGIDVMQNVIGGMMSGAVSGLDDAGVVDVADIKAAVDGCTRSALSGLADAGVGVSDMTAMLDNVMQGAIGALDGIGVSDASDLQNLSAAIAASAISAAVAIVVHSDQAMDDATTALLIGEVTQSVANGTMSALGDLSNSGVLSAEDVLTATTSVTAQATAALYTASQDLNFTMSKEIVASLSDGLVSGLVDAGMSSDTLSAVSENISAGVGQGLSDAGNTTVDPSELANAAADSADKGVAAADSTPPANPKITINANADVTHSIVVILTLSADGATAMYITNTAACAADGEWQDFSANLPWMLAQSDATATVYAKYKDVSGNETACVSASIMHQSITLPTPTIGPTQVTADTTPTWTWGAAQGATHYVCTISSSNMTTAPAITTIPSYTAQSLLTDDDYTLCVKAADDGGNWSPAACQTITVKTSQPPAPTLSGVTSTNNQKPQWNWNSITGANVYRTKLDSSDFTSGTTDTTHLSLTPATNLAEGVHTLYVKTGDLAGNWSEASFLAITVDITPPPSPSIASAFATYDTTPTWTWSENEAGVSFQYTIEHNAVTSEPAATGSTSYTPASPLAEGDYTLCVQAGDAAGNWSNIASRCQTITVDTHAPTKPVFSSGTQQTNNPTPTWSWTPVAGCQYRYKLDGAADFSDPTSAHQFTPSSNLSEAVHTLTLEAGDAAGNWSADATQSITVDYSAPATPTFTSSALSKSATPTWSWNPVSDAAQYRYQLGSSSYSAGIPATSDTSYMAEAVLSDGAHTLYVWAEDDAGNVSTTPGAWTITIDTAPPTATISGTPGIGAVALNATVGGTDVISYKFKYGLQASTNCSSETGYSSEQLVATALQGSLSGYAPRNALRLCVIGKDTAGNWQTAATSYDFTKTCTTGQYESNNSCTSAPVGYYAMDGLYAVACSNAPPNSHYTDTGVTTLNCPYACNPNYTPNGSQCDPVADSAAPSVGSGGYLGNIGVSSFNISWGAAADNITSVANLKYAIYRSNAAALISTPSDAQNYGTLVMDWNAGDTSTFVQNFANLHTQDHYFVILVKDQANNTAAYPVFAKYRNLLSNPGAEDGWAGWNFSAPYTFPYYSDGWAIVPGGTLSPHGGSNMFITSYSWCSKTQTVDLSNFNGDFLDSAPKVTFSEYYGNQNGRTWAPAYDQYTLSVSALNGSGGTLVSGGVPVSYSITRYPDYNNTTWYQENSHFSSYGTGLRSIVFTSGGQDGEGWGGQYGAIMDDAEVFFDVP